MSADATLFLILTGFLVVGGGGALLTAWIASKRFDREFGTHRRSGSK